MVQNEGSDLFINVYFNKLAGKKMVFTILEHVADLRFIVKNHYQGEAPSNLYIDSDIGSDAAWNTIKARYALGTFWKDNKSGVQIVGGPCPNNSSASPIEPAWSNPKKAINGLVFSDRVGNDTVVPEKQSDLTVQQKAIKDLEIWRGLGETLVETWKRLSFGNNPIQPRYTLPKVRETRFPTFSFFPLSTPLLKRPQLILNVNYNRTLNPSKILNFDPSFLV